MLDFRPVRALALMSSATLVLSGCMAAAIPLVIAGTAGEAALGGFTIYKTVQLSSGSKIHVEFPGKDGKTGAPEPLPVARRVAVWPGDESEVHFAQRLQQSGRFEAVATPTAISAILTDTKTPADLRQLTEQEESTVFDTVCRRANADLILGSRSLGTSSDTGIFSFASASVTSKADLFSYSCAQHRIVWRDQIALVVDVGSTSPSEADITAAASDAWADRILEAMGQPSSNPKA